MKQAHDMTTGDVEAALDAADNRLLAAAVAESLAEDGPDIPHEDVRAEALAEASAIESRLKLHSAA